MKRSIAHLAIQLAFCCSVLAYTSPLTAQAKRFEEPGEFITALATDPNGSMWVGTEDRGVFRLSSDGATWTSYTTRDGLGDDNAYALCFDQQQRVWVGHQRTGVSVFNGKEWRNYDTLSGPIGERIFDLACSPTDGDVWCATSAGLSRYKVKADRWFHFTTAHGLPGEKAVSIDFDARGRIWVAFDTAGVCLGNVTGDMPTWKHFPAPSPDQVPPLARGRDLPTSLNNDLLVAMDGTVYVATCSGLAWSGDGAAFQFLRGRDYVEKTEKRWGGPPRGWKKPSQESLVLCPG